MVPQAKDGDYAVSTKFFLRIHAGDILVFRSPVDGRILIKRVKRLEATPDGPRYFMEGDNRMRSTDSNLFGSVGRDSILGKVFYIARNGKD